MSSSGQGSIELPLGLVSFRASSIEHGLCGINGLPLTPRSVRCVGRFESLRALHHHHLCQLIHIERDKYERVVIVTESYGRSVDQLGKLDSDRVVGLMRETLLGLSFLHARKIVHRCLQPSNILLDTCGHVKLSQFFLFHVTGCNVDIDFLLGSPVTMAPEVYLHSKSSYAHVENYPLDTADVDPSCDVWSFGVTFLLLLADDDLVLRRMSRREVIYLYLRVLQQRGNLLTILEQEYNLQLRLPDKLGDLLRSCLHAVPSSRPSVAQLLESTLFADLTPSDNPVLNWPFDLFDLSARYHKLITLDRKSNKQSENGGRDLRPLELLLKHRSLSELFYWWNLAGGDLQATLREIGVREHTPALLRLPSLITVDGFAYTPGAGLLGSEAALTVLVRLPSVKLQQRVERLDPRTFFPTLLNGDGRLVTGKTRQIVDSSTAMQPKLIKENDVQYQIERVILMDRILKAFPFSARLLRQEAFTDIPPFLRPRVSTTEFFR